MNGLAPSAVVFLVTVQVAPEITANRILSPHLEVGPGGCRPPNGCHAASPASARSARYAAFPLDGFFCPDIDAGLERLRRKSAPAPRSPGARPHGCHRPG